MALTPEDVLNKTFATTQFRRGYDEREVDDFLDDIVVELRRVAKESEDLRTQVSDCREGRGLEPLPEAGAVEAAQAEIGSLKEQNAELEARVQELEGQLGESQSRNQALEADGAAAAQAASEGRQGELDEATRNHQEQLEVLRARAEEAERAAQERIARAQSSAEEAEAAAQQRIAAAREQGDAGGGPAEVAVGAGSAAGVLALAQRLHDEHVAAGEAKRDELVGAAQLRHDELLSTGQSTYDELLSTGQSKYDELLSTGQSTYDELLSSGQAQHDNLIHEAQTRHDEMITEARERSTGMVHEAQQKKQTVLGQLADARIDMERRIGELRNYEKDYRARLKSFIADQLEALDHTAVEPAPDTSEGGETGPEKG